ncbi:MAG: ATP-binding cassette domain-containing protein [Methyloprofundus sp.]|nr:ATP-binding cassette domain-containing protein [Methyloprofundus sp.]
MAIEDSDIVILGASENNLKGIDVRVPLNKITCITGKSGSGKSSLAYQILARESLRLQRISSDIATEYDKYVRPSFNQIKNLPNSVAVKQASAVRTETSSVATYSGLNNYLRKLFVNEGEIRCSCGKVVDNTVSNANITPILNNILGDSAYRFLLLISKNETIDIRKFNGFFKDYGINRFLVDGKERFLDIDGLSRLSKEKKFTVKALVGEGDKSILFDLNLTIFPIDCLQVYHRDECLIDFKHDTYCHHCYSSFQSKSYSLFTRKKLSKLSGACLPCGGKGNIKNINYENLINTEKSIADIEFMRLPNNGKYYRYVNLQNSHIAKICKEYHIRTDVAFINLKETEKEIVLNFLGSKLDRYVDHEKLNQFIIDKPCMECNGSGFNKKALSVFFNNKTISDIYTLTVNSALEFFAKTELHPILDALNKLALGHLELGRATSTLSGGELQRLKLVEIIIQKKEPLLLILDEPSVGLHKNDLYGLFTVFRDIVSQGNTLLIVDHNPWVISQSDNLISIGPGAGEKGGRLFNLDNKVNNANLTYRRDVNPKPTKKITFTDISYRNINRQSFELPLHQLVCLVGVSGSGKSSLSKYISQNIKNTFEEIICLNQFSIGKNKRSTIATYLGVAESLRNIYALAEQSMFLGLDKSDFSSNSKVGACKVCAGLGEFQNMPCYGCNGKKLNSFILSITIDEKNISESLHVPIEELEEKIPSLFMDKKLNSALKTLIEIGLGHLTLGREIPSISGGEAQRVKLAKYLVQNNNTITNPDVHNLLILDEPSQGLDASDSLIVLNILYELVKKNNTVLIIEHNETLINQSDYIIELGPKAGSLGGNITFHGSSEEYISYSCDREAGINKFIPVEVPVDNMLYPSAIINNKVDNAYFEHIDGLYSSYRAPQESPSVIHFENKKEAHDHYMKNFQCAPLYFNPFGFLFVNSPYISSDEIAATLLRLKRFMFEDVFVSGDKVSVSRANQLIDNLNSWSVMVRAKNFNQAFELGAGWVIVEEKGSYWHLSVPMLSIENKVFSNKNITKDSFNLFLNKCSYCSGKGEVNLISNLVSDPALSILDEYFYNTEYASVIKSKLLRKLKVIVETFKSQKLFDFDKPFNKFSGQDLIIYQQGFPSHQFLKKGGRSTAKGDAISWPGMTNFLIENIKYFPVQKKQALVDSLKAIQCSACNGKRYNHRLNYYLKKVLVERDQDSD